MSITKNDFKTEKAGETATVSCEKDDAFFADTELTKKQFKEVFDHSNAYLEKCATVASEVAVDIMSKDNAINNVMFTMPYGVSKRGSVDIRAKRTVTFPGIGDKPDVTRADLRVIVKDPLTKVSKTGLRALQQKMTKELLD